MYCKKSSSDFTCGNNCVQYLLLMLCFPWTIYRLYTSTLFILHNILYSHEYYLGSLASDFQPGPSIVLWGKPTKSGRNLSCNMYYQLHRKCLSPSVTVAVTCNTIHQASMWHSMISHGKCDSALISLLAHLSEVIVDL